MTVHSTCPFLHQIRYTKFVFLSVYTPMILQDFGKIHPQQMVSLLYQEHISSFTGQSMGLPSVQHSSAASWFAGSSVWSLEICPEFSCWKTSVVFGKIGSIWLVADMFFAAVIGWIYGWIVGQTDFCRILWEWNWNEWLEITTAH